MFCTTKIIVARIEACSVEMNNIYKERKCDGRGGGCLTSVEGVNVRLAPMIVDYALN